MRIETEHARLQVLEGLDGFGLVAHLSQNESVLRALPFYVTSQRDEVKHTLMARVSHWSNGKPRNDSPSGSVSSKRSVSPVD